MSFSSAVTKSKELAEKGVGLIRYGGTPGQDHVLYVMRLIERKKHDSASTSFALASENPFYVMNCHLVASIVSPVVQLGGFTNLSGEVMHKRVRPYIARVISDLSDNWKRSLPIGQGLELNFNGHLRDEPQIPYTEDVLFLLRLTEKEDEVREQAYMRRLSRRWGYGSNCHLVAASGCYQILMRCPSELKLDKSLACKYVASMTIDLMPNRCKCLLNKDFVRLRAEIGMSTPSWSTEEERLRVMKLCSCDDCRREMLYPHWGYHRDDVPPFGDWLMTHEWMVPV
jgi:hypothetical protein